MSAQKDQFLTQIRSIMSQLGDLSERCALLAQVFADRSYDGAAADPIVVEDLTSLEVAPYDLGVAVNIAQDLNEFVHGKGNEARRATINKWRNL